MTQTFVKWPKYFGNDLDTWNTPFVFEKRLYYTDRQNFRTCSPKYSPKFQIKFMFNLTFVKS